MRGSNRSLSRRLNQPEDGIVIVVAEYAGSPLIAQRGRPQRRGSVLAREGTAEDVGRLRHIDLRLELDDLLNLLARRGNRACSCPRWRSSPGS